MTDLETASAAHESNPWAKAHGIDPDPGRTDRGSAAHGPLQPDINLPLGPSITYRTLTVTSLGHSEGEGRELDGPVDFLNGDSSSASLPAEGVLLTHEQAWRMKGVTLGRLLHSMTLAPGEVTQIAVSSWDRRTHGRSAEASAEVEHADQAAGRSREISEVTTAVADEHQSSFGFSTASSSQSDAGVNLGVYAHGGSSNSASGMSVNFGVGSRSVSADSNQRIRQATHQHASNVRGRRSAVVEEIGQGESEEFRTRVVANYNRTHSLNMLYFEVLQVLALSTKVTNAERCLFLPMRVMAFDDRVTVAAYASPLATAARTRGQEGLAQALEGLEHEAGRKQQAIDRAANQAAQSDAHLSEVTDQLLELESRLQAVDAEAVVVSELVAERAQALRHVEQERERRHRLLERSGPFGAVEEAFEELGEGLADAFGTSHLTRLRIDRQEAVDRLSSVDARRKTLVGQVNHQNGVVNEAQATQHRHWRAAEAAREAAEHVADDVINQLEADRLGFNQAIWAQMEPWQVASMLAGRQHKGRPVVETLDPRPLAVFGTYVGFRFAFATDQQPEAEAFRRRHLSDDGAVAEDSIVLPTSAVFAEAVPGTSNSAEKLDIGRFWNWDESTIPILPTTIERLRQQKHAQRAELRQTAMGAPAVSIGALPDAPAGPAHAMAAAVGQQLFRDVSGSDTIDSLITEAQKLTKAGSAHAQKTAHDTISSLLDHAEEMVPKVIELMNSGGGAEGGSKLDPSTLGGLQNALGSQAGEAAEGGEAATEGAEAAGAAEAGIDVAGLLGEAAELGVFLL